jgi:hypothetical protein
MRSHCVTELLFQTLRDDEDSEDRIKHLELEAMLTTPADLPAAA